MSWKMKTVSRPIKMNEEPDASEGKYDQKEF